LLVTDVAGLPATPLPTARATAGRVTLVVAHGNSLRALCMILDELSPEQVRSLHIPTGVPLRHDLDEALPHGCRLVRTGPIRGGRGDR
jgi:broad specificity phosphatase PhoE